MDLLDNDFPVNRVARESLRIPSLDEVKDHMSLRNSLEALELLRMTDRETETSRSA
jgi:hypothetical protein